MNVSLDLMLKFCVEQNAKYNGPAWAGCRFQFEVVKSSWSQRWLLRLKK